MGIVGNLLPKTTAFVPDLQGQPVEGEDVIMDLPEIPQTILCRCGRMAAVKVLDHLALLSGSTARTTSASCFAVGSLPFRSAGNFDWS